MIVVVIRMMPPNVPSDVIARHSPSKMGVNAR
jgi:hypothetical protein